MLKWLQTFIVCLLVIMLPWLVLPWHFPCSFCSISTSYNHTYIHICVFMCQYFVVLLVAVTGVFASVAAVCCCCWPCYYYFCFYGLYGRICNLYYHTSVSGIVIILAITMPIISYLFVHALCLHSLSYSHTHTHTHPHIHAYAHIITFWRIMTWNIVLQFVVLCCIRRTLIVFAVVVVVDDEHDMSFKYT